MLASGLALGALVALCVSLSIRMVFLQGQDALLQSVETVRASHAIQQDVLARTPVSSVIVVDRADKLFFPHRLVRYPLRSDQTYALLPRLVEQGIPLYYFGITFPPTDLAYLNEKKLAQSGLLIEWVQTYGEESLYRLYAHP